MKKIEKILNCTDIYVLAKDKNAKYIYCNEKYAELLNLDSPKKIIGKTDYDFFPENIAAICLAGDKRVLSGDILWNYSEAIKTISPLTILINKTPIIKTKGIDGVVASFIKHTPDAFKTKELMNFDERKKRYYFKINQIEEYFTELEYAIFKKLFLGLSCKKIAVLLSLSPRTIEAYIVSIKRKLQCAHKNDIIQTAIRLGITHTL